MIVEKITPYELNWDIPKLAIQFKDTDTANRGVSNWNRLLCGGSTARKPVRPNTLNNNCAMMYNTPMDSNTVDNEKDVKAVYPTATIERLGK